MVRVDGGDNQLAFTKGCKARTPLHIDILNSPQNCLIRARASAHVLRCRATWPVLAPPRAFRTPSSWTEAPRPAGAAAPGAGATRPPEPAR
eukprot:scaffold66423_cov64-Phaeocystis_antarctica.AAC.1